MEWGEFTQFIIDTVMGKGREKGVPVRMEGKKKKKQREE